MTEPAQRGGQDPPPAHLDPIYQEPSAGAPPPPATGRPPVTGPLDPAAGTTPTPITTPPVADPDAAFGKGSGIDLVPVSRDMAKLKEAARSGDLKLDEETAAALLKSLADIKDRVEQLTVDAMELDVPLQLGDNWVGHAMSRRLHAVAQGQDSAAIRVFKQFLMVVEDYEHAVRAATKRYYTTEDELSSSMGTTVRTLAETDGSAS